MHLLLLIIIGISLMVYKYLKIQLELWSLVLNTTQGSQAKFSVEITATHPWSCKATPLSPNSSTTGRWKWHCSSDFMLIYVEPYLHCLLFFLCTWTALPSECALPSAVEHTQCHLLQYIHVCVLMTLSEGGQNKNFSTTFSTETSQSYT
jgi:hypothetical protein